MSKSYYTIWIHAIWSTKYRLPLIQPHFEDKIHDFIREQLRQMGCPVRIINGMPDHVHCLFLLNPQKTIVEVIKHIKGSSAHFVNEQELMDIKFAWQTGYAAFSVSASGVEPVFQYIKNQKTHHKKNNFQEEYDEFIKLYEAEKHQPTPPSGGV